MHVFDGHLASSQSDEALSGTFLGLRRRECRMDDPQLNRVEVLYGRLFLASVCQHTAHDTFEGKSRRGLLASVLANADLLHVE
jgi:hypothetical protein